MKKMLLLFLTLIFTAVLSAEEYSVTEQKEILKQFTVFQKAVKSKDINTLSNMVEFPLQSSVYGKFPIDDEDGVMSKKAFMSNKNNILNLFDELTLIKVDSGKNSIAEYTKKNKKEEINSKARFLAVNDEVYQNEEKAFVVVYSNDEIPEDDEDFTGGRSDYFFFQLKDNKLKLVRMYSLP